MKKTAHQVWKQAQKQNLNAQQFKDLLIKEEIVIKKIASDRQREIATNIQKRLKS